MEPKTENEAKIKTAYDDLKLKYLTLEKLEVCENYTPKENNLEGVIQAEINNISLLVNKKQDLIQELTQAIEEETRVTLEYDHKYNDKLLNTDFKEVLQESRPNKDQKEAHIVESLKELYDAKEIAIANTKLLRKQLELIDDRISLEKTICYLRKDLG